MNYDAIVKRANKLIDKAASRVHASKVHIVEFGADVSELSGLVIILAKRPKPDTQNSPPEEISAS